MTYLSNLALIYSENRQFNLPLTMFLKSLFPLNSHYLLGESVKLEFQLSTISRVNQDCNLLQDVLWSRRDLEHLLLNGKVAGCWEIWHSGYDSAPEICVVYCSKSISNYVEWKICFTGQKIGCGCIGIRPCRMMIYARPHRRFVLAVSDHFVWIFGGSSRV